MVASLLVLPIDTSGANSLRTAITQFGNSILPYAVALAAVGALAMALIEAWKKVWDTRTKFQARRFTRWVLTNEKSDATTALTEILQLCTGVGQGDARSAAGALVTSRGGLPWSHAFQRNPAHAVFALELERMMGAIQDAADLSVANPTLYPAPVTMMTRGASESDVEDWRSARGTKDLAVDPTAITAQQRQQLADKADRLARLRQIAKRKLDGFQLYAADQWASGNQLASIIVGAIIMFGALWSLYPPKGDVGAWVLMVILSLIGGILAPVAKDLVTALKKVKDG